METLKRPTIKLTGGPHGIPRAVVHEVQRGRLLDAIAEVIAEEGYLDATVHQILHRAGISRRTYYELFKDKEDCFLVAYDEAAEHLIRLVGQACHAHDDSPEQRIERGLRAMLEFAEREPTLARAFIVEAMAAGQAARQRRAQTMERFTCMIAAALSERPDGGEDALLQARVLTGGVHELVYDSLSRGRVENLSELASQVVASHLSQVVASHLSRSDEAVREARALRADILRDAAALREAGVVLRDPNAAREPESPLRGDLAPQEIATEAVQGTEPVHRAGAVHGR